MVNGYHVLRIGWAARRRERKEFATGIRENRRDVEGVLDIPETGARHLMDTISWLPAARPAHRGNGVQITS